MIKIKRPEEIELMRVAGRVTAEVLDIMRENVRPGISTGELDRLAEEHIRKNNGIPAFKNYKPAYNMTPFPGTICASINEEVVHGIPDFNRILQEGDIISVDVGAYVNGYCGDAACTYAVGAISPEKQKLLEVTEDSLNRAIAAALKGNTLGDIGYAVESYVKTFNYGVVRDYTGHGIGKKMHEAPQIPNYGKPRQGLTLKAGMTIAIEPMIMSGREDVKVGANGWTVSTVDGSDAAHFERSIVILDDGPEILTKWQSIR
ncbi:MAG: type I methionyl aminopeptidase [Synergistales bacterium]|nr:type I methionyl aminopeptidase [Synergistales bacterium]MDY6401341.1 type I methionyl aminopeptidase [Synergistales bacterium]MDY6405330.1 type I methionyl aminopeptidase [Synergistales bacterium]MDY6411021.1 type I methionyl aminopeptidase [Synergistales bacterium]MDY6414416.1 type I methionyl aminopeptidase [Synergistales bacterium]